MSNVKPGDIARIAKDHKFPANVGAMVFVVERYEFPLGQSDPRLYWVCEALQPIHTFNRAYPPNWPTTVTPGRGIAVLDENLRRIDPPTEDETDETSTPKETAHALP